MFSLEGSSAYSSNYLQSKLSSQVSLKRMILSRMACKSSLSINLSISATYLLLKVCLKSMSQMMTNNPKQMTTMQIITAVLWMLLELEL